MPVVCSWSNAGNKQHICLSLSSNTIMQMAVSSPFFSLWCQPLCSKTFTSHKGHWVLMAYFSSYEVESIWAVFIRADGGKSRWRSMSTCILSEVKAQPISICVRVVILIMAEEVKANLSLNVCSTFSISFCSLSICTIICFSYSEWHVNNVVIMQRVTCFVEGKYWKKKNI